MAITWTVIIVLGALLHGMQCNTADSPTNSLGSTTLTSVNLPTDTAPLISSGSTEATVDSTSLVSTTSTASPTLLESTTRSALFTPSDSNRPTVPLASPNSTVPLTTPDSTKATSPGQTGPSSTVANQDPATNATTQSVPVTTQITTVQPTTPNTSTASIAFNDSSQNSPTTVITSDPNQNTTNLNKPATTISIEDGLTSLWSTQTNPSAVGKPSKLPVTTPPDSKSTDSQSFETTTAQTTIAPPPDPRSNDDTDEVTTTSTSTPQKIFNFSFDLSSSEGNIVQEACKTLDKKMKRNCMVTVEIHDKQLIARVTINADQMIPTENYKQVRESTENNTLKKEDASKDTIPDTLIAILASCGALVLILCCFAAYCTYHRRSYRKNQQHLTEELQTVENGYHDNPTLEVMEVQPEMQEKKVALNGEFNDSWIVPIDNLLKEDIPDEEDTHL